MERDTLIDIEEFERLLNSFDWTYQYSRDYRTYSEHYDREILIHNILSMAEKEGNNSFRKLYNANNPFMKQ